MIKVRIMQLFIVAFIAGCGGPKTLIYDGMKTVENQYATFTPPLGYYIFGDQPWKVGNNNAQWVRLYTDSFKGAGYEIKVQTWPFSWRRLHALFERNAEYKTILTDEDMKLDANDREQGIGYRRLWVNYVQGLKCYERVFSRSHGGVYKDLRIKNYSFSCGYYDKTEGKRILGMSYRYSYSSYELFHPTG